MGKTPAIETEPETHCSMIYLRALLLAYLWQWAAAERHVQFVGVEQDVEYSIYCSGKRFSAQELSEGSVSGSLSILECKAKKCPSLTFSTDKGLVYVTNFPAEASGSSYTCLVNGAESTVIIGVLESPTPSISYEGPADIVPESEGESTAHKSGTEEESHDDVSAGAGDESEGDEDDEQPQMHNALLGTATGIVIFAIIVILIWFIRKKNSENEADPELAANQYQAGEQREK